MRRFTSTYRYFLAIVALDLIILMVDRGLGVGILSRTASGFYEMLAVLPPIFVLLGLLDVWVPRDTMVRFVGDRSGITGALISVILGAAAAGPLYAAFPVVSAMARKGAGFFNLLILLGAWSTLKIPQFLFEVSALGFAFAITRWAVNIIGIIVMAAVINRLMSPAEKAAVLATAAEAGSSPGRVR